MAQHHGGAAEGAVLADLGAAGHADAAGHRRVRADMAVVADLDLVIQLDAVFDDGIGQAPRSMVVLAPISTSSPITPGRSAES
jgi:hypothetical protein